MRRDAAHSEFIQTLLCNYACIYVASMSSRSTPIYDDSVSVITTRKAVHQCALDR